MIEAPADAAERTRDYLRRARADQPQKRVPDIARDLDISEAALLDSCCGFGTRRLQPSWDAILNELTGIGPVMALTRNPAAVIETTGCFENLNTRAGVALGEKIDLRLFLDQWQTGFAVEDQPAFGFRRSLQFFDAGGRTVFKIFAVASTDLDRLDAVVGRFSREVVTPAATGGLPEPQVRPDAPEVDRKSLQSSWAAMRDTHDVFALLEKLQLTRLQALRLLDEKQARPVDPGTFEAMLTAAAAEQVPLMVFVGNPGTIQIHTGTVSNVKVLGDWVNVLDPELNLHVLMSLLESAWVVQRPTVDGPVTSLDLFDRDGNLAVQVFGKRKPGIPELESWRDLLARSALA